MNNHPYYHVACGWLFILGTIKSDLRYLFTVSPLWNDRFTRVGRSNHPGETVKNKRV